MSDVIEDLDAGETTTDDAAIAVAAAAEDKGADTDAEADAEAEAIASAVHRQDVNAVKAGILPKMIEHRKAAREAATRATAAETERDALKVQLDKVNGDVAKLTPVLQALHARPDLVEHLKSGTRPSAVDHPQNTDPDPKMIELAKDWELFDSEGNPDAARAARIYKNIADPIKATAEKTATEKVKPLLDQQVATKAHHNKSILYEWAKQGHCTKEGVDKAIAMMPGGESLIADDGVRDVIYFLARGMNPAQAAKAAGVAEAETSIVHTETAGGRGKSPTTLPSFSKNIAARRGKTEAEWAKIRDNDSDVLE